MLFTRFWSVTPSHNVPMCLYLRGWFLFLHDMHCRATISPCKNPAYFQRFLDAWHWKQKKILTLMGTRFPRNPRYFCCVFAIIIVLFALFWFFHRYPCAKLAISSVTMYNDLLGLSSADVQFHSKFFCKSQVSSCDAQKAFASFNGVWVF